MSSPLSLNSSFYLSTIGIMRSGDAAKDDPGLTNSEEKKLRLFGFEVKASVDMVKAAPLGFCAKKEKTSESGTSDQERKYECQFCFKEFANSQALGGHQNAHKKERMKKKRLLLQARKASFSCYLQPFQNQGGFTYHGPTSTPWTFHDSSTCSFVPADFSVCEESLPGFVPLERSSCMKGFSFTSPSSLQSQGSFRQTTGGVPNNYSSSSASNTKHDHMTLDLRLRLSVQSNACKASGTGV